MRNTIMMALLAVFSTVSASAQFHTVVKEIETEVVSMLDKTPGPSANQPDTAKKEIKKALKSVEKRDNEKPVDEKKKKKDAITNALRSDGRKFLKKPDRQEKADLPELTIPSLYEEIKRHGIQYPKIVLAQAILETGWFHSNVCQNKNNLFGLRHPRTGKYFEFDHWTDSVRAYYSKVQYRYKGGNYLLWLKRTGYAEDQEYIRAVIKVLRML